jgi:hypothetical protein
VPPYLSAWRKEFQREAIGPVFCLYNMAAPKDTIWSPDHQVRMDAYGDVAHESVKPLLNRWWPKAIEHLNNATAQTARCPFHKFAASQAAARLYGLGG